MQRGLSAIAELLVSLKTKLAMVSLGTSARQPLQDSKFSHVGPRNRSKQKFTPVRKNLTGGAKTPEPSSGS